MSNMFVHTHFFKRNSCYYFRAKVPVDLRSRFGKKEVKYSLKTKDLAEAKLLVRQASVEFDKMCAAYRKGMISSDEPVRNLLLDEGLIQTICDNWKYLMLEGDERMRMSDLPDVERQEQLAIRAQNQVEVKQLLAQPKAENIELGLQHFLGLQGIRLAKEGELYKRLLFRFLQTFAETNELLQKRDAGEVVMTPPAPEKPLYSAPVAAKISMKELLEDWKQFQPNRPPKTVDDVERTVELFEKVVGTKAVETISRQYVMQFRDHLVSSASTLIAQYQVSSIT